MRVALCCLAKCEHLYINDFVKWYVNIGVDTIYLFDNDNIDSPNIRDFIDEEYLKHVVIFDIRGLQEECMQQHIYDDFYKKYKNNFDWCLFCDIDEYLIGVPSIKTLLKLHIYDKIKQIRIKWRLFGDDDLIERDMTKPVYKVFKKELNSSLNRDLIHKGNLEIQGKFIIKGHLDNVYISSPHFASYIGGRRNILESCLPSGKPCNSQVAILEDYSKESIFLNHYMTKSLSEFINQKMGRNDAVYKKDISLEYYWRVNKPTKEKLEYLEKVGIKYELQNISDELR